MKLSFRESDRNLNEIPLDVVLSTFTALSRTIKLLLGAFENPPESPLSSYSELQQHFNRQLQLSFAHTERGSFEVPIRLTLKEQLESAGLFSEEGIGEGALQEFKEYCDSAFITAVQKDRSGFLRQFPNESNGQRVANEMSKIAPRTELGLVISSDSYTDGCIFDSQRDQKTVEDLLRSIVAPPKVREKISERMSLVAEIEALDAQKRTYRARTYDGLKISGDLDQDLSGAGVSFSPKIVEFEGEFEIDEDESIGSVREIYRSTRIDKSPLKVTEIQVGNERLRATPPLEFQIRFHKSDFIYYLDGEFDLRLHAYSRHELEEALYETLEDWWIEYALEEDNKLTSGARKLKTELKSRFKRI